MTEKETQCQCCGRYVIFQEMFYPKKWYRCPICGGYQDDMDKKEV